MNSAVREQFPGALDKVFLDAACLSLAPVCACDAMRRFLDVAATCPDASSTAQHVAMDEMRLVAVTEAARLLHTTTDQIALVESTTHGLNVVAQGVQFPPGSRILVSDMEFLQVPLPWAALKSRGLVVEAVPNSDGRVLVDGFARRVDASTRAMVLSSVQWNNGYRVDLAAFGELARDRDLLLVVDAVQQLGALDMEPERWGVHVLAAGGHKWLNAPFGCGILYVAREWLDRITPAYWGYLSLEEPEGGWGTYFATPTIHPIRDYSFVRTAKRFEIGGTSNYPGAVGLGASIGLVNSLGISNVEDHILSLSDRLIEGLARVGATLVTPAERASRSGIVVFRFYGDLDRDKALLEKLNAQRIMVSMRFTSGVGGIRVSCHYFNNTDDVDSLTEALEREAAVRKPDYRRTAD